MRLRMNHCNVQPALCMHCARTHTLAHERLRVTTAALLCSRQTRVPWCYEPRDLAAQCCASLYPSAIWDELPLRPNFPQASPADTGAEARPGEDHDASSAPQEHAEIVVAAQPQ